ncbi:hypothetical protein V6N12_000175 [Hibiscus sabdariffa]|uniref:RNase H type-1 domain-containing protein n=1 Tax=Hibiscus sabdariffa TaxID=183260 RepID=A0ABR2B2W3_9ROSI
MSWISPPTKFIKFNVDGAMKVDGSAGGIGGTIRTPRCETLIFFYEPIDSNPPILAELLAIKFGITLFYSLKSRDKSRLVVESDCKTTLEWISNPSSCPTMFPSIVQSIVNVSDSRNMVFKFIPRSENVGANMLAKEGIGVVLFALDAVPELTRFSQAHVLSELRRYTALRSMEFHLNHRKMHQ